MEVFDAIRNRRSIRRFQNREISEDIIRQLLELGRYYPAPANVQSLKFAAVLDADKRAGVYAALRWAGYLPGYQMAPDERPMAYIVVLGDKRIAAKFDYCAGAATTELTLGAEALGLASCILGIPNQKPLYEILELDEQEFEILYVVALGYAAQSSRVEDQLDSCRYHLDENGNLIVPKRTEKEITVRVF